MIAFTLFLSLLQKMDAGQRAPYQDKAKEEKIMTSRNAAHKLTCTGVPVSQIEKEKLDQENKVCVGGVCNMRNTITWSKLYSRNV